MSFPIVVPPSAPKYLRLRQIAKRYPVSYDTVRRVFIGRRGVIGITKPNETRRKYVLWLVPEPLVIEVMAGFTNGGGK